MQIGIITFQETNNYGAILQNYALQQALKKLGYSSQTIDYKSLYIGRPYSLSHLKKKGIIQYLYGVAGYLIYLPRTSKCNEFKKQINYSRKLIKENLSNISDNYDFFITGSDQVFNYKLTGKDGTYLLDFVTNKCKCNSYAASFGVSNIPEEMLRWYMELLKDYHYITVREKTAVDILEKILHKRVEVVSDPCMLLSKDEWKKVTKIPDIKKPYILVYQLSVSPDIVNMAKKISKQENLKIIFIPFPVGKPTLGRWKIGSGPAELLGYIQNAEYVLTDSFHGTLFSIIFNKKFFVQLSEGIVSSRIKDLLETYKLENRILSKNVNYKEYIQYEYVNKIINQNKEYSYEILKRICDY